MNDTLLQLLISLKLGDGSYITHTNGSSYYLYTSSICLDYLAHKRNILETNGLTCRDAKCSSGYSKESKIYGIRTLVNPILADVAHLSVIDAIQMLDISGLIYLYLDDGSLHKHKHFMHIYCNSFTDEETNALISKIYEWFPTKPCAFRHDCKSDGRKYPYIYMPVCVAKQFNDYVYAFVNKNNISSMYYKTFLPSQTIESIM